MTTESRRCLSGGSLKDTGAETFREVNRGSAALDGLRPPKIEVLLLKI